MGKSLLEEIRLRSSYLQGKPISTIYFGGGTPSILPVEYIESIISLIRRSFFLSEHVEITLEANPDDLNPEKLNLFHQAGINRLSIGVQSFDNAVLRFLNRVHNGRQAYEVFENARMAGFRNINMDIIYGIPDSGEERWKKDLEIALDIFPEHISSYALTIEPGTVFGKWLQQKKMEKADEETEAREYEYLVKTLQTAGYDHYEISNFALPGHHSKHNTSYWLGEHYLGLGPGAHSYDGVSRQHNINNNSKYIAAIQKNEVPGFRETLTRTDQANEYLLTSLRTSWGIDLKVLRDKFQLDLMKTQGNYIFRLVDGGLLSMTKEKLVLTEKGKLLADQITEDLFLTGP